MSKYQTQTVPVATPARIGASAVRLMFVVIGGHTANTTVQFKNAATDTGDVLLTVSALANGSEVFDFTEVGGLAFSTGCFCKPVGANAIVYAWFE